MPLYDFKCSTCNNHFTVLQKYNDPNPKCPQCGSSDTQKQLSAPGHFDLKGGGYYATDFKNKK
jgi:putative FmdB family regulatory protein